MTSNNYKDYTHILEVLKTEDVKSFEELSSNVEGFPKGCDEFLKRHWITNAIDCGSLKSIEWMISKNVSLDFVDDEGCTVLLSALDRENREDKYLVLELLLKAGAPVSLHGFNDFTAMHRAATNNDVEALKLLVKYGANPEIKTRIDLCATPLEEAEFFKNQDAIEYLKSLG